MGERLTICVTVRFSICTLLIAYTFPLVWSNFEIADMDFWRSEAYQKFFAFLDTKGGFYYEVRGCSCGLKLFFIKFYVEMG